MISTPEYLISTCAADICRDPDCREAVKVRPDTGRAYLTMGHPGFNSPANNRQGYASPAAARAALRRYAGR